MSYAQHEEVLFFLKKKQCRTCSRRVDRVEYRRELHCTLSFVQLFTLVIVSNKASSIDWCRDRPLSSSGGAEHQQDTSRNRIVCVRSQNVVTTL